MVAAERRGRVAVAGVSLAVALLVLTGALGPSAAQPPLGPPAWHPPYSLAAAPSPWLVTGMLLAALVGGALAVGLGLAALRAGWVPSPRRLLAASAVAVAALLAVPPMGSADHLVYAAYGEIAARGGDPYRETPADAARRPDHPVSAAVEAPWQDTPSVYGPLATAEQALAAKVGRTPRGTVAMLALANGLAFLGTGMLLQRLAGSDVGRRRRAAWLWSVNPLLLWAAVAGAHLDGLAVAAGVAALVVLPRSAAAAGALAGAAVAVKASFGLFGLALVLALLLRRERRPGQAVTVMVSGGLVVAAAYAVAGLHALGQVREASRFISRATPWNLVRGVLDDRLGTDTSRPLVGALALLGGVLLAAVLARAVVPAGGGDAGSDDGQLAARWAVALVGGWLLTAPYSLPWYDVMLWAPLAALPATRLDGVLLARSAAMAAAYVPGRAEEAAPLPAALGAATRALRGLVTPSLTLVLLLLTVAMALAMARSPGRRAW